ncbi:unnamed protein product [Zymoseptoria tritici ST99CH_3D1]|uniref:Cytochrome b561 domain-containing protein n=1 Tax=Zymoseptoria tritici (strain CBS 115943 / IPO323) TaxID=336722 RepID=F9XBY8_ZYMTI|nr:uncharacterized protein MYCGRDRAFT_72023 [Zymoseptoria tritici IPO323]EGP87634.1 hypothetical protein MYCGRDRAFT_72023 [Zymoseptoria tritici IPO323]SMR53931.1 unnamed protein product [Zymoseptoria tritici ST99CH_3D1]
MKNAIAKLVAAAGIATLATAQVAQSCHGSNSDLCYSLNIPETTSSSGTGDIFFQIRAPTTYSWVALGQGSRMRGANMFVIYASEDGNVTLSPRLGVGNVMPLYNEAAKVELLGGTGIENGMMTANVRCSSCNTWEGGSMSFQNSSASWIWSALSGDALNSNDPSESISYHNQADNFNWDFSQARGGSAVNPFVASDGTSTAPTAQSSTPMKSSSKSRTTTLIMAHGFMAAIAWIIIFPIGGIIIRVLNFRGLVWVHAGIQALGWLLFVAAVGLGLHNAIKLDLLSTRHIILGLVVFCLFALQPVFGLLHHLRFKKTGSRGIWSYIHIWIGRVAIVLAMINGGLGLADARTFYRRWSIVYGVIAGVFGLAYIASIVFGEAKRSKKIKSAQSSDVADSDRDASVGSKSRQ